MPHKWICLTMHSGRDVRTMGTLGVPCSEPCAAGPVGHACRVLSRLPPSLLCCVAHHVLPRCPMLTFTTSVARVSLGWKHFPPPWSLGLHEQSPSLCDQWRGVGARSCPGAVARAAWLECTRVRAVSGGDPPMILVVMNVGCAQACGPSSIPRSRHRSHVWGSHTSEQWWGAQRVSAPVHVLWLACLCAARHLIRPVVGLRPRRCKTQHTHPGQDSPPTPAQVGHAARATAHTACLGHQPLPSWIANASLDGQVLSSFHRSTSCTRVRPHQTTHLFQASNVMVREQ